MNVDKVFLCETYIVRHLTPLVHVGLRLAEHILALPVTG